MRQSETIEVIRELVVRGQRDELLNYLRSLVRNREKKNDIVSAVMVVFADLKPEEWTFDHLTKLKAFSEFSGSELGIKSNSHLYIYDATLFNCLTLCNDFYSGELTDQKARDRLQFVRSAKLIFIDVIEIDSFINLALDKIDYYFEKILSSIAELSGNGMPRIALTDAWHVAFDPIHRVICSLYFVQKVRISPQTYDALVVLLNLLYAHFISTRYSYSRNANEEFGIFFSIFGFYNFGGSLFRASEELINDFQRRLLASNILDSVIPWFLKEKEKPKDKWLNTHWIFNIIKLLFDTKKNLIKKKKNGKIYENIESVINKFQFQGKKGTIQLCYFLYQYDQFTYEVFCQVFCNALELGEGASIFWRQLNKKIFKNNIPKKVEFFEEKIYRDAFLESPHLAPTGNSNSRAQQLLSLMLRNYTITITADLILLTIWLDSQLKVLNYNLTEIIFSPKLGENEFITKDDYLERIFQYFAYLLLMLHLYDENISHTVNPTLIASFFSDDWSTWRSALYAAIESAPSQILRDLFSINDKTDFDAQSEKLRLLARLGLWTSPRFVDLSQAGSYVAGSREIDFLCPLNSEALKKLVSVKESELASKEEGILTGGWIYFEVILPLTVRLVRNYNFSAPIISHFLITHLRSIGRDVQHQEKAFINNAEAEFQKRFVNITDAKNVLMHLVAWSANQDSPNKKLPRDIMFKIAFYFLPGDYSSALRACFFNLISREFFIRELKSAKLGDAHCYAAIRECYPITEDPEGYKNSIEELINQNIFTKENVEKLQAESEKTSLASCKLIHK